MALHPSLLLVKVRVTEPAETLETKPAFVIVAILLLLEVQLPFVEGVTLTVFPKHTDTGPPVTGAPGTGFITTPAEAGDVQLLLLVTTNVYVALTGNPETV